MGPWTFVKKPLGLRLACVCRTDNSKTCRHGWQHPQDVLSVFAGEVDRGWNLDPKKGSKTNKKCFEHLLTSGIDAPLFWTPWISDKNVWGFPRMVVSPSEIADQQLLFNGSVPREWELFQIIFLVNQKRRYTIHFWVPSFRRTTPRMPAMVHQMMFFESAGKGGGMPAETSKVLFFTRLDPSNQRLCFGGFMISMPVNVAGQSPKSTWNFDSAQPFVVPLLNYRPGVCGPCSSKAGHVKRWWLCNQLCQAVREGAWHCSPSKSNFLAKLA